MSISPPACIHALVEAQVRRTPDAVALSCDGRTLSYAALDRRANRIAHLLRRHGVGPEVRVAIHLERTPELVAALLGVLKAGGAYLPLDPAYPRARLDALMAAARPAVLLTQPELAARLPAGGAATVVLDGDAALADLPETAPEAGVDPENLSHVIHTSGSTGVPRGVMIRHAAVSALIGWARGALGIGEGTAVLASTSVSFDVHVAETWVPLALGARVVLVADALHLATVREPVEVVSTVPSAAAELLRTGAIPPTVRQLNVGGEPLRRELAEALLALPGAERVLNLYGPTEDTTYSTCARVERGEAGAVPVGFAVDGTRVQVVRADGSPAAPGESGEVYLSGAGLGRGYLDAPAATAERWLPDPAAQEPGARRYRVGDLGRVRGDGALECLGRIDHQVKVRGFRVELGEVEEALRAHPAVADAVATVREDAPGDRFLAGYAVPRPGEAPSPAELRAWVALRLPEHAVPSAVAVLGALPRLPNGKVDRGALPPVRPEGERPYRAPRTAVEEAVCRVWEEVLASGRVGIDDDFFELGGHSLRATQVVARLREGLGVALSPFALFSLRTPAEVAAAIGEPAAESAAPAAEPGGAPALAPADRAGPIPLSFSQQAIWFFQELSPGMRSYDFQAAIRFRGRLEVEALERALTEIVRRHEIFRTEFRAVDGIPRQVVRPPWPVSLPVRDLRAEPEALDGALAAAFREPFRVDRLPLVRWALYRTADEGWTLSVAEHHFVHDGWSFGVFLRELTALYAAFAEGRPSPLAEPELQFADYALWQRRWAAGAEAARQLAYWKRRLAPPVPVLELPTDRPRPATMRFRGAARRHRLDPALAARAREAGAARGATLYSVLLAAYQALLHRWSGQGDFAVGAGVANRNERASEALIGMIVNTVAIRAELEDDPTVAQHLARVHAAVTEAYAHREIPFGEVVEAVQPERALSHLPVYQTAFSFHDAPYPSFDLPGARMEVEEALSNGSAKFDLQVVVIPRASQRAGAEEEVTMIWEYATDLFHDATVERMERHYRALLRGMLDAPGARVSELPLLDDAERAGLLAAGTGARAGFDPAPVHLQFAARAAERPEALAVEGGGARMTYGELAEAAARIAGALRAAGAGPERVVAVCAERSPALVAGLLGALYAGAAYLPLDPADPDPRIARMLRDSGAVAVLAAGDAAGRLAALGVPVLPLGPRGEVDAPGGRGAPAEPAAEGLAYVVYTSGSTGEPKGVLVEHRGLANVAGWTRALLALRPGERGMLYAAVGFDALAWEVWPFLAAGASLHVVPPEVRADAPALAAWIAGTGIHAAFLTTRLAEQALAAPWPADLRLRALMTGGERMPAHPGRPLPFVLHNNYGPTETTVICTTGVVPPEGEGAPSLGRAVPNTAVYLLDGAMRPVPEGAAGEVYVGGVQVSRGYLGRPAATAAAFLPDPFAPAPGARLYRTGDRARWSGGALRFLGRTDGQAKVRGFRVEPAEVEAALRGHPRVVAAAAAARTGEDGAARLVAWVAAPGADADFPRTLRAWLRERVPAHLVPSAVEVLAALPLRVSGKADVAALPTPRAAAAEGPEEAPASPAEARLAEIVAELLGVERVGRHAGFFELGGDSILAMRLVARAREAGLALETRDVFQRQTVAAMAAEAEGASDPLLAELAALEEEDPDALLRALAEVEGGAG